PFGNRLQDAACKLPCYELTVEQEGGVGAEFARLSVTVTVSNIHLLKEGTTTYRSHAAMLIFGDMDNRVIFSQRITDFALLASGTVTRSVKIERAAAGDQLFVNLISNTWAGLDVQSTYNPSY
ncbi:unnamed protein product, partial [Meganyctiphanes norvegica]